MTQSASPRTRRRSQSGSTAATSGSVKNSRSAKGRSTSNTARRRRSSETSDVLVSAVISTYLLTHLHHVLQRAEYGATQEGRSSQASNYAQLRKVLCMDARSMEDASALGQLDDEVDLAA
ncbi:MAG: hypothetical protein CMN96_07935 [Synechococcus sp. MED850]|jgi:hypothetical protein|nr:hypothetical protein [Synechococcus sp. MED850]OUW97336.1 MAG: hypothetical protein CBD89_05435 [Cyanobacteria bacterium TMED229]